MSFEVLFYVETLMILSAVVTLHLFRINVLNGCFGRNILHLYLGGSHFESRPCCC